MRYYLPLLLLPLKVFSLPSSPEVISGKVAVQSGEKTMQIEASDKAIINYSDFSLGKYESLEFIQPSTSSSVLNRVTGENPSQILGSIESNGRVFLVNEKGVYFGPDAVVNVGSLIVSTLAIQDKEFSQDSLSFTLKNSKGRIENCGALKASKEGAIVLLSPYIENSGSIEATAGKVLLAGGEKAFLSFDEGGLIDFCVEGEIENAVLSHLGKIHAPEGSVAISLAKANKSIKDVVNKEGVTSGEVFAVRDGKVYFLPASEVIIEGSIQADEGAISLEGDTLRIEKAVLIAKEGTISLENSERIFIDKYSSFSVDSKEKHNAGSITILSNEQTVIDGATFSAQGGRLGGDGGLIETSSNGQLLFTNKPKINTLAPHGTKGNWLLDPSIITITNSGSSPIPTSCVETETTILASDLNGQSSDITLCAEQIIVEAPIALTEGDVSITFIAPEGITGALHLQNDLSTRGGNISIERLITTTANTPAITTRGGAISLQQLLSPDTLLTLDAGLGTITFGGAFSMPNGVLIAGGHNIKINAPINVQRANLFSNRTIATPFPITVSKDGSSFISVLGNLGMPSLPLQVVTTNSLTVGASILVNILTKGNVRTSLLHTPCYFEENGIVFRACASALFLLPKSWFRFGVAYSTYTTGAGPLPLENYLLFSPFEDITGVFSAFEKGQ